MKKLSRLFDSFYNWKDGNQIIFFFYNLYWSSDTNLNNMNPEVRKYRIKKSRIRETKNLSTDADSRTDTIFVA